MVGLVGLVLELVQAQELARVGVEGVQEGMEQGLVQLAAGRQLPVPAAKREVGLWCRD